MSTKDILIAVLIPLLLAEFGSWCGWLAGKLVRCAALLRYGRGERAEIRSEEWLKDLDQIPGQLTKLAYAVGQLAAGSACTLSRRFPRHSPPELEDHEVSVALIPEAAVALRWLQERTGLPETDITNRAIASYEFFDAQLKSGRDLIVRDRRTGETRPVRFL